MVNRMNNYKFIVALFVVFCFAGCSNYIARYSFEYEFENTHQTNFNAKDELFAQYEYRFENDVFKLHLFIDAEEIGLYLINKSKYPLKIIWDSVKIYSDYIGNSPIPFLHTNKSQDNIKAPHTSDPDYKAITSILNLQNEDLPAEIKPIIVLSNKTWMDEIIPSNNQYLLPYINRNRERLIENSDKVIGSKLTLVLPLKHQQQTEYFTFVFTLKNKDVIVSG